MSSFRFSPRPNRASEIRWQEWGDAAFALAHERDVPVLLAISAVWCHWCHVMDETSYTDADNIGIINERYVAIRVDNDARPDVNRRYNMGGWPTTAFLTPDGEIIHGGTYIPPDVMQRTLLAVSDLWKDKKDDIQSRVADANAQQRPPQAPGVGDLTPEIVGSVRAHILGQYDREHGGFGREPKFPQTSVLRFLLNEFRRHGAPDLAAVLRTTLDAMSSRGMYDHVEGGFFRYATLRDWTVPHYEKMLEDNAELLAVYADAHAAFPEARYDAVVRDVIRWMDASLFQPETGLWSGSQDADEHYYTLNADERGKHEAPFVDRTLYTSWNVLAARAYLRAGEVLEDKALALRGRQATLEIGRRLRDATGALYRFDAGRGPEVPDLLGDSATFLGLLTGAGELDEATAIAARMRDRLEDRERGGFFDRPEGHEPGRLARRERPIEENATAAGALLGLAVRSDDDAWHDTAMRALRSFSGEYRAWGMFAASYADVVARALRGPLSIVVVGRMGDPAAEALWRAARSSRDPDVVAQHLDPGVAPELITARGLPLDRTAAYLCVGTSCSAPLTDEGSLRRELDDAHERLAPQTV